MVAACLGCRRVVKLLKLYRIVSITSLTEVKHMDMIFFTCGSMQVSRSVFLVIFKKLIENQQNDQSYFTQQLAKGKGIVC